MRENIATHLTRTQLTVTNNLDDFAALNLLRAPSEYRLIHLRSVLGLAPSSHDQEILSPAMPRPFFIDIEYAPAGESHIVQNDKVVIRGGWAMIWQW